jgi:hypothetical protein
MTCLPQSGGECEKPYTDAFATHLNNAEGTHYVHQACLDILERKHPQPEALYLDSERTAQLVIERKSICSPKDYFHRHSNDHFVSDMFEEGLRDLIVENVYEISLPMLIMGTQPELRLFVQSAVQSIRTNWPRIVEVSAKAPHTRARACPTLLRAAPRGLQLPAKGMLSRAHVRRRDFVLPPPTPNHNGWTQTVMQSHVRNAL